MCQLYYLVHVPLYTSFSKENTLGLWHMPLYKDAMPSPAQYLHTQFFTVVFLPPHILTLLMKQVAPS